ncbi:MAG TPA: hypothetical protein VNN07_00225 [Candidatus Tectomicrobia bacterium]|nr:hypothetical protein [Candidatus Tectomicrobia bacterium]
MTDRRYRQQGYRSEPSPPRRPPAPPGPAPRGGGMLAQRTISRCAACGVVLPVATSTLEQCPNCRAAIHACRQCTHFDPGRRFECDEPIPARLADKSARNDCPLFSLRATVERDASPDSAVRPADARRAFDNLFKK